MWGHDEVGDVVDAITRLEPREEVQLDPDRLAELFVQLGQQGAEDVVCRAMEEISLRLAKVNAAYDAADLERVRKLSRSLVAISDQVGLSTLACVAGDVADCAAGHDRVALLAVVLRLQRIGESSVTAVWDIRDMSV